MRRNSSPPSPPFSTVPFPMHGPRQRARHGKNAARGLQRRGPFAARFWSETDQKWPIVGHVRWQQGRETALMGPRAAPRQPAGPFLGPFWAKSGQIVSQAPEGPFSWPETAHFWAADGPQMGGIPRRRGLLTIFGQKLAKFGPHLASCVGGVRRGAPRRLEGDQALREAGAVMKGHGLVTIRPNPCEPGVEVSSGNKLRGCSNPSENTLVLLVR